MSLDSLKPFLEPRSIAMIGASENPNKIGGRPIAYLQRYGFKGKVYPINPTRKELQGQACYPSLADVPEVPDLAVVAVPGDNAIAAVKDCAARGVKAAIVMSSGFGETSAPEGKAKEREMVAAARAAGMRMVGPEHAGARQLRQRRSGQLLDLVHGRAAGRRSDRHGEPERRHERRAGRIAAAGRGSACAIRWPPATMPT